MAAGCGASSYQSGVWQSGQSDDLKSVVRQGFAIGAVPATVAGASEKVREAEHRSGQVDRCLLKRPFNASPSYTRYF